MIFHDLSAWRASGHAPQVCIVGAGPAGLALAFKLEKLGIASLVLEAGGASLSEASQDAYRGPVVGDDYYQLHRARLRYLGGSSGHWEGWCRGLDAVDFEPREGLPHTGWPIRKADLDPYAAETEALLEIQPVPVDQPFGETLREVFYCFSTPVRFGTRYWAALEQSRAIAVVLDAPVVDLQPARSRLRQVTVRTRQGGSATVEAPYFALCTGGIENSRLLLWANAQHERGVVPQPATLGRYWMEHPVFDIGEALITRNPGEAASGMRFFAPLPATLKQLRIGNFGLRLMIGTSKIKRLLKSGMCVAPQLFDDLVRKYNAGYACGAQLRMAWEQMPSEANRVELDGERDANGVPRSRLVWKKEPSELRTAKAAAQLFGEHLVRSGMGRLKVRDWLLTDGPFPGGLGTVGFHHMGGTRMAAAPSQGVVDRDCKVFGVDNLYIGGSSVFPTGGQANPTYAIVQLALRLGDHLGARLGRAA